MVLAVIGVIGPDDPARREALRIWTRAVPSLLVRFAISSRGRPSTAVDEDVDLLDCAGQAVGGGVVQLALFDAWLRYAVRKYPTAPFIGRADDDTVPNPHWLSAVLASEVAREPPLSRRLVYAGLFQWYSWDERAHVPRGWGMGPWNARRNGMREHAAFCGRASNERCAGPLPFATGPLLLLSSGLARWYATSVFARAALQRSMDSRLNLSSGAGRPLTMQEARRQGHFKRPADASDMEVCAWCWGRQAGLARDGCTLM